MIKCQSCKINAVDLFVSSENEDYPYQLCTACHYRLTNRALRPLEYFNLTAKHGMTYLLWDDFYNEAGEAFAAEVEVEVDRNYSFPTFEAAKQDLEVLLDYAIVMWTLEDRVVEALHAFDKMEVLESVRQRIYENRWLGYRLYDIAARVLGSVAADWIREEWQYHTFENLENYAECLARCLPLSEGFYYYTSVLDHIEDPHILSAKIRGLIDFQSELGLDWIEKNIHRVSNISDAWGQLAVASQFDWPRAKQWLEAGRPLSLVALDALANCRVTAQTVNSTLWLTKNPQRLLHPDSVENMNAALNAYLAQDCVPRVRKCIALIQDSWHNILKL